MAGQAREDGRLRARQAGARRKKLIKFQACIRPTRLLRAGPMCRARSYPGDVHDQTDRRTTQATGAAVQEFVRKGPCAQNDPVTSPSCAIWRGMYNANCKNHHVTRRIAIESRSTMPCKITGELSVKHAGFRPARPRTSLMRRKPSSFGLRSGTRWTGRRFAPAPVGHHRPHTLGSKTHRNRPCPLSG